MIEINLVPDVKQELIKAQRIRASVISIAVVIGIAAIGVIVALALYVFAVQTGRGFLTDQIIASESKKLSSVEDISDVLTIQNQLTKLNEMHNQKHITSRIFDILATVTPQDANKIATTNLVIDTEEKLIKIDAQADNSYTALEVFKKTILGTKLKYTKDGAEQSVPLAETISLGEQSYGEDASGKKVLRFSLSFRYPEELFSRAAANATIVAPDRTIATDSYLGVPKSLFAARAEDLKEGE